MHFIEATHDEKNQCHYRSTSSIRLFMNQTDEDNGYLNLKNLNLNNLNLKKLP